MLDDYILVAKDHKSATLQKDLLVTISWFSESISSLNILCNSGYMYKFVHSLLFNHFSFFQPLSSYLH